MRKIVVLKVLLSWERFLGVRFEEMGLEVVVFDFNVRELFEIQLFSVSLRLLLCGEGCHLVLVVVEETKSGSVERGDKHDQTGCLHS